jgi:hypothetical protein
MVSVGKIRSNRGGSHSAWIKLGNKTFENTSIGYNIQALNKGYEYGVNNAAKRYSIAASNQHNASCNGCSFMGSSDAYHLGLLGSSNQNFTTSIGGCVGGGITNCCPQLDCSGPGIPSCAGWVSNQQWHWNYDIADDGGVNVSYNYVNANGVTSGGSQESNNCCSHRCVPAGCLPMPGKLEGCN